MKGVEDGLRADVRYRRDALAWEKRHRELKSRLSTANGFPAMDPEKVEDFYVHAAEAIDLKAVLMGYLVRWPPLLTSSLLRLKISHAVHLKRHLRSSASSFFLFTMAPGLSA